MSERLLPEQRIRQRSVFEQIFRSGLSTRGRLMQLWVYRGPELRANSREGLPQIGVIVSRRVSLRATARNRWKRRIREIFRKLQSEIKPGTGILVRIRSGNEKVSFQEISSELKVLLTRSGSLN